MASVSSTMSDSPSKDAHSSLSSSFRSPIHSEATTTEQWSEVSSPDDSLLPSRSSLSIDGDEMSPTDKHELAAFFVNAARDANVRPTTSDAPQASLSRANCVPLTMPKNFAQVLPGVYRAHYPVPENFTFLRMLGIKTILTLVPEEAPSAHRDFMTQFSIQHFQIGIEPNKDPAVTINPESMQAALRVIAAKENHPILIHCNKGKHRTGCVVACLRKILGWTVEQALSEYRHHAGLKARALDECYIAAFDEKPFQLGMNQPRQQPSARVASPRRAVPEPFSESPVAKKATISTRLRG